MAFYNAVTALDNKERATDVIYLDICNAFDIVPTPLPLNTRDKDLMHGLLDGLAGCMYPKSCHQQLNVQMETSNNIVP